MLLGNITKADVKAKKHAKQQNNQLSLIMVVMTVIVMKMDDGDSDEDG